MTRKQKLILNTGTGLLKQIIIMVCGFILPKYMLLYYGSSVNGLVSSITSFLGFISLMEMGMGPVVQANLYGPLAKKDNDQISKIVISCESFFRRVAYIFLVYIAVLVVVFPSFINPDYDFWFTASLILIIAISTFAQYFFGATYQLLLNADQKAYVQTILQIVTVILNTILSVVLMQLGASVQMVKLLTAGIYVLRPLGQSLYVRKHYTLDKKLTVKEEPIKQKWNGFAQHLSATICTNIGIIVLSFFSSMENVSIYSVYYNVTNGVTLVITTATAGLEAYFGNIIAQKEKENLVKSFENTEWLLHTGITIVYVIAAVMITPFVTVYTQGVTDADYYAPLFGVVLVLAYAMRGLRTPYFVVVKAAGHFKQTQNGSFIATALNIVISLICVLRYGLIGAALGTLVAMVYQVGYLAWYLRKSILNRPFRYCIGHMLTDVLVFVLVVLLTKNITMTQISYIAWVIMACKVGIITVTVSVVVNLLLHHKEMLGFLNKKTKI